MLSLQLKSGDYLTIGEDIVVQVVTNATIQVLVHAPREIPVLRGELREQMGGERPACLYDPQSVKARTARKTKKPRRKAAKAQPEAPPNTPVSPG